MILAALSLIYLNNTAFSEELEVEFDGWDSEADTSIILDSNLEVEAEPSGIINMEAKSLDHDILKISVVSIDMAKPVLGLAFHLNYDPGKVRFLKYDPGDFLEQGGDPFYLVQNDEKKKEIVFGETLRRDDKFPVGGGRVANFYFQISKKQAMNFNFKQGAVSTMDTVRQDIDRIEWQNLRLDKNGRKIVDEVGGDGVDKKVAVDSENLLVDSENLPENFWIMVGMGVVICGLSIWVFVNRRKKKNYRGVTSI